MFQIRYRVGTKFYSPDTFEISAQSAVLHVRPIVSCIPVAIQASPTFLEPSLLHSFPSSLEFPLQRESLPKIIMLLYIAAVL